MEPTNLPAKRLNETSGEDKPQIFRTLRNIDLNLLTIFEAVYVHKGIVNAAKILNLTPSAISQSIQKLRAIFPDPLFIRKGQGVTPTAYATHLHEYISQGLESILGALDLTGSYEKQRTITIGTSPSVGVLVMPAIYQAVKQPPQLLIRNARHRSGNTAGAIPDGPIIDGNSFTARALGITYFIPTLWRSFVVRLPCVERTFDARKFAPLRTYIYVRRTGSGSADNVDELFPTVRSALAVTICLPRGPIKGDLPVSCLCVSSLCFKSAGHWRAFHKSTYDGIY
ncbi:MAG: YbeF family transcriptional regulator [Enterobacter hormaechei]